MRVEKPDAALESVGSSLGAICVGPGVVEKSVSAAGMRLDLEGLHGACESGAKLVDIARRDQRIVFAEYAEIGTREIDGRVEWAPWLRRVSLGVAEHAVEADAGRQAAQGTCG